jgi:pimeloyl-ACP methyl ester carboxylesterase
MKLKNDSIYNYYQNVPDSLLKRLNDFRQNNALHEIKLKRHEWTYYAVGDSQNEPLLLLHGGGGDAEAMFRYIEGFAEYFYVIAPNIPAKINKIADAISGLHTILAHENIAQVHLVGISFGAMLAQSYIRSFADTVLDMLITHTVIPSAHLAEPVTMQKNMMMLYPASLLLWFSKRAYGTAIANSTTATSEAQKLFWQAYFEEIYSTSFTKGHLLSRARITADYHSNYSFKSDDLRNYSGNLLIIESSQDDVISDGNRGSLLGMYPRAFVQTLYGYDHLAPFLAGEEMLESMMNFLLKDDINI